MPVYPGYGSFSEVISVSGGAGVLKGSVVTFEGRYSLRD
jgi:hypothetical protein